MPALALAIVLLIAVPTGVPAPTGMPGPAGVPVSAGLPVSPPAPESEFPASLGSFSTTLIGSLPARTGNIRLAAQALDGAVLLPGESLSFNLRVGPRSAERGYLPAPVILHETRQVQTGGGVCQAASTLFVAALLSGLTVEERWRHSTPVDYIPLGEDATIAWGAKDLRVRNDFDQAIRLRMEIVGSTLSARFEAEEGIPDAFDLETVVRELPGETAGPGGGSGREIEVFRIRSGDGGSVEREFLHRDVYPPSRPRGDADRP